MPQDRLPTAPLSLDWSSVVDNTPFGSEEGLIGDIVKFKITAQTPDAGTWVTLDSRVVVDEECQFLNLDNRYSPLEEWPLVDLAVYDQDFAYAGVTMPQSLFKDTHFWNQYLSARADSTLRGQFLEFTGSSSLSSVDWELEHNGFAPYVRNWWKEIRADDNADGSNPDFNFEVSIDKMLHRNLRFTLGNDDYFYFLRNSEAVKQAQDPTNGNLRLEVQALSFMQPNSGFDWDIETSSGNFGGWIAPSTTNIVVFDFTETTPAVDSDHLAPGLDGNFNYAAMSIVASGATVRFPIVGFWGDVSARIIFEGDESTPYLVPANLVWGTDQTVDVTLPNLGSGQYVINYLVNEFDDRELSADEELKYYVP